MPTHQNQHGALMGCFRVIYVGLIVSYVVADSNVVGEAEKRLNCRITVDAFEQWNHNSILSQTPTHPTQNPQHMWGFPILRESVPRVFGSSASCLVSEQNDWVVVSLLIKLGSETKIQSSQGRNSVVANISNCDGMLPHHEWKHNACVCFDSRSQSQFSFHT